jgi:hypothetical protein
VRRLATADRIRRFLALLGARAPEPATAYLTGGGTAVLIGWRDATVDIDIKFVPDSGAILRLIPPLKEELEINVELASPDLFLPMPDRWQDDSPYITTEGRLTIRHFNLTAQAVSKLERGHEHDLEDVRAMLDRGLVAGAPLVAFLDAIEPELYRFPAVDPPTLRRAVEEAAGW